MKDIVIYGAGGFGREVLVLIKQINTFKPLYNIIGFIDDNQPEGKVINGLKVLGDKQFLLDFRSSIIVAMAIIAPSKPSIVFELKQNHYLVFDNIIHPTIYWDETNTIKEGNILCHGMNMTCNINIGSFNIFNGRVGLGHDVNIGSYHLFGPNAFIAGSVNIGDNNVFAMNSSVLQKKKIGDGNTINMNSVLIKNIKNNGLYFGVPAIKQDF
jgi:sugar O-acyltransferase (sialic acid O-acetyltransferase NeuD family)